MLDYIIIGGGTAGCVLAARLSEDPAVQVALLEAGSADAGVLLRCPAGWPALTRGSRANWQFRTTVQPGLNGRQGYQPRGKVLGGCSAIGAMVHSQSQRADFDGWAAQGHVGWGFDDVRPYFECAVHRATQLAHPSPLSTRFIQASQQAGHENVGLYPVMVQGGERVSTATAYLGPALARPNLHVITGAHVTRILLARKRAVGVQYSQGGELKQLNCAREVLLCAGSLQSPQILMLSGIGDHRQLVENGIATLHDLPGVGEHLHDPVGVALVVDVPGSADLFGISPGGVYRAAKGFFEWRKQRSGPLASNGVEAGGFIKSQPSEAVPDLQLQWVSGKLRDHGLHLPWGHGYSLQINLLRPASCGSVRLDSKDPYAAPLIDPNFLTERADVERLINGFKQLRQIAQQPALASLGGRESKASRAAQSDLQIEHFIRDHADTSYNPVGSCRMGKGEFDVVDAQLRVHGIQGLRVADASIMPRGVSGGAQAAVAMIAQKAAAMIRD